MDTIKGTYQSEFWLAKTIVLMEVSPFWVGDYMTHN